MRILVKLIIFVLIALATCLLVLNYFGTASAQTDERCFMETGFCIAGPIRAYWEANGGLPVFGYPTIANPWTASF
jgi:hypothetical protein